MGDTCSIPTCKDDAVVRLTSDEHIAAHRMHHVNPAPLPFCLAHAQEYRMLGYRDTTPNDG